ncbi:MAG: YlxR family protein [Rhodoluna sp.]|nr:YlxR family protein [Rhodoluna sp.]
MEPVRTCVGCRQRAKQQELLRLIASGESLVIDRNGFGRGAWLHQSKNCLELAISRFAFSRALRTKKQFDTAAVAAHIEQAEMMLAQK